MLFFLYQNHTLILSWASHLYFSIHLPLHLYYYFFYIIFFYLHPNYYYFFFSLPLTNYYCYFFFYSNYLLPLINLPSFLSLHTKHFIHLFSLSVPVINPPTLFLLLIHSFLPFLIETLVDKTNF